MGDFGEICVCIKPVKNSYFLCTIQFYMRFKDVKNTEDFGKNENSYSQLGFLHSFRMFYFWRFQERFLVFKMYVSQT